MKVMVYDERCDFTDSCKVKPEVHSRYENATGHAMLDEEEQEQEQEEQGAGRNLMSRELVDTINGLSEKMGQMQLGMQGIMDDMFWMTEEFQRVIGRHCPSTAPPPDELTGPVNQNHSSPLILPSAYGTHPSNPPTPTIDSWMYQPSLNTPTESTWTQSALNDSDTHPYQFPAVPEAGTPTTGTTRARTDIFLFNLDDLGPQYIEGSSTGQSARETGEIWQHDFADDDEGMN